MSVFSSKQAQKCVYLFKGRQSDAMGTQFCLVGPIPGFSYEEKLTGCLLGTCQNIIVERRRKPIELASLDCIRVRALSCCSRVLFYKNIKRETIV